MLEKGSLRRKLLCLLGWHHWTIYRKDRQDHFIKFIIFLVVGLGAGLVLLLNLGMPLEQKLGNFGIIVGLVTFSIFFFPLPKIFREMDGPFDGSCIYCHKHVTHCTDFLVKKRKDDKYETLLIDLAREAYEGEAVNKDYPAR